MEAVAARRGVRLISIDAAHKLGQLILDLGGYPLDIGCDVHGQIQGLRQWTIVVNVDVNYFSAVYRMPSPFEDHPLDGQRFQVVGLHPSCGTNTDELESLLKRLQGVHNHSDTLVFYGHIECCLFGHVF